MVRHNFHIIHCLRTYVIFNNCTQFNHDIIMNVLHAVMRYDDVCLCRRPNNPCFFGGGGGG